MSSYNKNFIRIQPPLPPAKLPKKMPINTKVLVNDPFNQTSTWQRDRNKKTETRSRRRSRSVSRERHRHRSRSRSRSRRRSRTRSPHRPKPDARSTIRARHDEDRARGERRISNLNRIKGLQKKLDNKECENEDLRRQLRQRDYQYMEMKKRAMNFKQRLAMSSAGSAMNMPFFQPNMAQYMPFQAAPFPRSVSNETILCSSLSMAS